MKAVSKLMKLWYWPWQFKLLLVEALARSFFNEIFLKTKLFKAIKKDHVNHPIFSTLSESDMEKMKRVAHAMKLIEKYAPWRPKCYNRALTAKQMLSFKNIETSMHIGFRKQNEHIKGHAWLTYKGKIVTGFVKGIEEYNKLEGKDFLQKYIT